MGQRCEVYAHTSLEAREKAIHTFQQTSRKKVKPYDVSVTLAQKDGEQVVHTPMM